ncbi:hypothetical protein NHX12_024372 [Muraenolepis orangiensis]|uniref:DNA cross-link repair 1A protein n=1 Tax=Muraenolepis orangiensis TaxID=630683 RepID=A0A9Q0EH98_9TELE|nr:hypothetical protein NHX12_024372 [Muraenolepis orangiensis]
MSQKDDSEDDVWEYKPLRKKKKKTAASTSPKETPKRHNCSTAKSSTRDMPFSILVAQSQTGHATECLDTPRDDMLECPDGLQCSSVILNHYKRYNHALLAHGRAANNSVLLFLSQTGERVRSTSDLESSQDSATNSSTSTRLTPSLFDHNASPVGSQLASTPSQVRNSLLLLRSPELPAELELEAEVGFIKKALFPPSLAESEDSLELFSDNDDDLFTDLLDHLESDLVPEQALLVSSTQPALSQRMAGQVSSFKQTDIGVFFGLKSLKDQQGEPGSRAQAPKATTTPGAYSAGGSQRGSRQGRWDRGERGARRRTTGPVGAQADAGPSSTDGGGPRGGTQGGGSRGGTQGGGSRGGGWTGRSRWNRGGGEGDGTRHCPFYKKIPGTGFAIDAFNYGAIEGISAYFLTHFHSDHYGGLTKKSTLPVYCNKITGNLVRSKLKVQERYLHILPMNTRVTVCGVEVTLMEANHCPGAAMLLFSLPDGQIVLHTGDFRANPKMESYPDLLSCRVQTLYLDTTYCSPEYTFPSQQEAVHFAANTAFEVVALHPRTLVVCGSYSVGKEKVFLALAEVLGSNICLSRDKYNTMCCLESEPIKKLLTTDWKAAQVHVLPMMQLNVKKLQAHLSMFSAQYDRLVAFKPTGWTFSQKMDSLDDIRPQVSGDITIYGVPYSEHSSFLEMKRFVQWLRPLKVIPTVNVGSWASRKAMEKCFGEWLAEANAKKNVNGLAYRSAR